MADSPRTLDIFTSVKIFHRAWHNIRKNTRISIEPQIKYALVLFARLVVGFFAVNFSFFFYIRENRSHLYIDSAAFYILVFEPATKELRMGKFHCIGLRNTYAMCWGFSPFFFILRQINDSFENVIVR